MAIRNIRTDEDSILRKKSRVVENIDDRIIELLDDMADTMYNADGVGLAAVQVGVLRRVVESIDFLLDGFVIVTCLGQFLLTV